MLGLLDALAAADTRVGASAVPERAASRANTPQTPALAERKHRVLRAAARAARRARADSVAVCCPSLEEPLWNSHPRVYLLFDEAGIAKCPYCGTEHRWEG
jgi:uncharacterized Zn-finger protein